MHRTDEPTSTPQQTSSPSPPTQRHGVAVRFAIRGDLRFISHQDTLRLWARAVVRAGLPVRYSQGMNPRPKLSLPLPRTLGVASEDEWLLIELTEPLAPQQLARRLAEQVPEGIEVGQVQGLQPGERWQPQSVVYRLPLPAEGGQHADWQRRISDCLRRDHLPVHREGSKNRPAKTLDIRPLIERLDVVGDHLEMELRTGPDGSARPAEVLQVLGIDPGGQVHRLVRQQIVWSISGRREE